MTISPVRKFLDAPHMVSSKLEFSRARTHLSAEVDIVRPQCLSEKYKTYSARTRRRA